MNIMACLCFIMGFMLLSSSAAHEPSTGKERLNIILIMADDLGYETLGANGGTSYQTPNLDRLAAAGARFQHCYAQPLCTPSRVKIMTGKYNVRNYKKFGVLPRGEATFAHLLKAADYATCVAGKWQLGKEKDSPQHFGFDEALLWQHTLEGREHTSDVIYDRRYENPLLEHNGIPKSFTNGEFAPDLMADFVCGFIKRKKDQPFFVYYPMILTHCPFVPTPGTKDWNPKSKGSPTYKGKAQYFGDMVAYMDQLVGRIVKTLEAQGLSEQTVILFTGDNGTDNPIVSTLNGQQITGKKGSTTNAGTRVPLIAYCPGRIKSTVIDDLVDFSDFFPTLAEIAGADVPAGLDGRSFLPQLYGNPGHPREFVYCWYSRNGKEEHARAFARTHRYKLYRNGEYYDVEHDPAEHVLLSNDNLTPEQNKIKQWLQEVIDRYDAFRRR